jgi:PAS domain S-box-containing protein
MKVSPAYSKVAATIAALLLLSSGSLYGLQDEQPETKRILVLFSYHEGLSYERLINESLRDTLASQSVFSIQVNTEHTNLNKYADDAYRRKLFDLYRYKYSHPKMDLVFGIGDEAVNMLLEYGEKLFPEIPMVFLTSYRNTLRKDFLKPNTISLQWEGNISANVELIREILPQTRDIFIVAGSSPSDRAPLKRWQAALGQATKGVAVHYLTDLSANDLISQAAQLPDKSAIIYLVFFRDAEGKSFVPQEFLSILSKQARVPIFGPIDTYLGYGIVGGNLLSGEGQGRRCAEIAMRILRGGSPKDMIPERILNQLMFDWRQLKRWGISEDKLPPGSIVRFKTYSFWELYRGYIVAALVLILIQSGLISFLLWQRAQRRRAQAQLAERLRFEEMLSSLSARFVNLPPDRLYAEIKRMLESIGKVLNVDRVSIFRISDEDQKLHLVHSHRGAEIAALPPEIQFEQIPWITRKLVNGESLTLSDPEEVPEEAELDRNFLRVQGTVSLALIPLSTGEKTLGILSLAMMRHYRIWPHDLIRQCRLVADVFANALVREHHEESLMQAEAKYRTVADFTYDWEYWANLDDSLEYVSPSCESISGYKIQDFIANPPLIKEIIVPEDHDVWDRHYHDSRQELKPREIQFRIQTRDGEIRWIEHNCQPVIGRQGSLQGFRASNRDITSRKLAEELLEQNHKDLSRLAGRIISVQEEELRRLSRELHDDLTQRLAAFAMNAALIEKQLSPSQSRTVEELKGLRNNLSELADDVHDLARRLHPSILDDLGLVQAVRTESAAFINKTGIDLSLTIQGLADSLPPQAALCLYRVIQEGLQNIVKHSGAKAASITLQGLSNGLRLLIDDKGVGFDPAEVRKKAGIGISSMRERVRLLDGEISFASKPGQGTRIEVFIPTKEAP